MGDTHRITQLPIFGAVCHRGLILFSQSCLLFLSKQPQWRTLHLNTMSSSWGQVSTPRSSMCSFLMFYDRPDRVHSQWCIQCQREESTPPRSSRSLWRRGSIIKHRGYIQEVWQLPTRRGTLEKIWPCQRLEHRSGSKAVDGEWRAHKYLSLHQCH